MTRIPALKSFYDSRYGLVELEDDVLGVVSRIREISDGRVTVELDDDTGWYHLVEHCEDTTDRLVFSTQELDGRVIERLLRADSQWRHAEDPYDAAEREQDEIWAQQQAEGLEKVKEAGEELVFHLRKAGKAPYMPLPVAIPKDVHADS
jgi:hypothetical protein